MFGVFQQLMDINKNLQNPIEKKAAAEILLKDVDPDKILTGREAYEKQTDRISALVGGMYGAMHKWGREFGFLTPAERQVSQVLRHSETGEYKGIIGDKSFPITGMTRNKDTGEYFVQLEDEKRSIVKVHQDQPFSQQVKDGASRLAGFLIGAPLAVYAFGMGGGDRAREYSEEARDMAREAGLPQFGEELMAFGGGARGAFAGAIESAARAWLSKNQFGSSMYDFVEATSGKTIDKHIYDSIAKETDPLERPKLHAAAKWISEVSAPTIEFLLSIPADPLIGYGAAARSARTGLNAMKLGSDFANFGKKIPAKDKGKIIKSLIQHEVVEKEVTDLMKNQGALANVLDTLSKVKAIDEAKDIMSEGVYKEFMEQAKVGKISGSAFDAVDKAVAATKMQSIEEGLARVAEWAPGWKHGMQQKFEEVALETAERLNLVKQTPEELKLIRAIKNPDVRVVAEDVYKAFGEEYSDLFKLAKENGYSVEVSTGKNFGWARHSPKVYRVNADKVLHAKDFGKKVLDPNEWKYTLIHELVHALTYQKLLDNPSFISRLEDIRHTVLDVLNAVGDERAKKFKNVDELVSVAFSEPAMADFMDNLPGTFKPKGAGEKGTIWDEFKDLISEGFKNEYDYSQLDQLKDIMDLVYTKPIGGLSLLPSPELKKIWTVGGKEVVTFEMTGLKAVSDLLVRGAKRLNPFKKKQTIFQPEDELFDIQWYIVEHMKEIYGAGKVFKKETPQLIREEAERLGFDWFRRGEKVVLSKGDTARTLNGLDEVSEFLGLGPKAKQFGKEMNDMEAQVMAEDGANGFISWMFDQGMYDMQPKQVEKALRKLTKQTDNFKNAQKIGDEGVKQAKTVLGRTPTGTKFFELVRAARDRFQQAFAADFQQTGDILEGRLRDKGFLENVRLYLDGYGVEREVKRGKKTVKVPPMVNDPQAKAVADQLRSISDKIYKRAERAKVKNLAEYKENYFAHHVLPTSVLKKGRKRQEVLDAVIREGKFDGDRKKAEEVLDSYIERADGKRSNKGYLKWLADEQGISLQEAEVIWDQQIAPKLLPASSHLTKHRIANVPWYERNLVAALGDYYHDAYKGIVNTEMLGHKKAVANTLIERIRLEGGNHSLAKKLLETFTGNQASTDFIKGPKKWQQKAMAFESVTKLNPLTSLVNLSQTMPIAMATSGKAWMKAARNWDRRFAERAGAITNQTIRDVLEAHGASGAWSSKYMKAIGFTKTEQILRTLAANAGKAHLDDMVDLLQGGKRTNYAKNQIRTLGLDADEIMRKGFATEQDYLTAGKRISDNTQFRGDIFDLPVAWLGGYARLVTQFKSFVYAQANFMKRTAFGNDFKTWFKTGGKDGNIKPAVFLLTMYPAVGMGYDYTINELLLGKEPPEGFLERYTRGLGAVGALGIFQSSLESLAFGEKGVLREATGPFVGDLATGFVQGYNVITGQSNRLPKEIARRTPFVGRVLNAAMRKEQGGRRRRRTRATN